MRAMRSSFARAAIGAALFIAGVQAHAACTFGGSAEPTLQSVLDNIAGPGVLDAQNGCLADGTDSLWNTIGSVASVMIRVELAGNAQSNTFGIYDANTLDEIRIFEGDDGANTVGFLLLSQVSGQWQVSVFDSHLSQGETMGWSAPIALTSPVFGFYLGTGGGNFYSDSSRNAGVDHMYAYGPYSTSPTGEYVIAWEDLAHGDLDFQDFVAELRDVTPVPLPTAIWLLGSALIGLAGVARRSR